MLHTIRYFTWDSFITFVNLGWEPLQIIDIRINGMPVPFYLDATGLHLDRRNVPLGYQRLDLTYVPLMSDQPMQMYSIAIFGLYQPMISRETRTFQPGDILVACDNGFGIPPGYMGHAAIVVDDSRIVESVAFLPSIRHVSVHQFLEEHPIHVQYRPKSLEVGKKAAQFAKSYYLQYLENLKNGNLNPRFSFFAKVPLDDPWGSIYCSKLVWLAYHYGAEITFINDFGLFAPEDLDDVLSKDDRFECVYRHPLFEFKIDL